MHEVFCDLQKEIFITILKVISLTGVCSSPVVAAPCFVGMDVVGGSKSNSILVSAKAMLTLSVILSSCCNANILLAK